MTLEPQVEKLLKQRYYQPGEDWSKLVYRVVNATCANESPAFRLKIKYLLRQRVFLPNSPCLFSAGTKNNGLVACFTVGPEEDTLEAHFETLTDIAAVGKFGGGCGFTTSFIRPKGSVVNGSAHDGGKGIAYGPNWWALLVSKALDGITQGGARKMALMNAMAADHGDIEAFIDLKQSGDETKGYNFNQSVMASDGWMQKALDGDPEASRLLDKIAYNAWNNGEPGLLFSDTINNATPYKTCGCKIHTTNPCGEQPLPAYLACVLASINVAHDYFWTDTNGFDFERFSDIVRTVTRFLDNVGSATNFPNEKFAQAYAKHRPIGVGIMGLADAFLRAGIKYGGVGATEFTENIFRQMQISSYDESFKLGQERGVPEHCRGVNRRNITTLTVAPTGSIAFIANCSHGIEPIFSKEYTRTDERGEVYTFKHALADAPHFIDAGDLHWRQHLNIQIAAQKYVDAGVSKTINLPNAATVEMVKAAFVYAWRHGCKGITVYRDGSRQKEVITTGKVDKSYRKRPAKLQADLYNLKPNGTNLVAAIGLLEDQPYEVFVLRHDPIQGSGAIVKNSPKSYDLLLDDGTVIKEIGQMASSEEQLLARLISLNLRSGVDIRFIVEQIAKAEGYVSSYGASVNRALKNYVNGHVGLTCEDCGSKAVAIIEGCETCQNCGSSKCS